MTNLDNGKDTFDFLAFEQEKGRRNLERAAIEPFWRIISELGYSETPAMITLREDFAQQRPEDPQQVKDMVGTYLDLGQPLVTNEQTELAFNLLLFLFYLPRQSEFVQKCFWYAGKDVLMQAPCIDAVLSEDLTSLIGKLSADERLADED